MPSRQKGIWVTLPASRPSIFDEFRELREGSGTGTARKRDATTWGPPAVRFAVLRGPPGRPGSPKSPKITRNRSFSLRVVTVPSRQKGALEALSASMPRFLVDFESYARVVAPERRANALETRARHLASTAQCLERSPGAHSHPDRKMEKFSKMEAVRPHRDLGALYTNFSKVEQGRSLDRNCSAC